MDKYAIAPLLESRLQDFSAIPGALQQLVQMTEMLLDTWKRPARVFTLGLGNAALAAMEMALLLQGCHAPGRNAFDAECLSGSSPQVDPILLLRTKARRGDVLLCYPGTDPQNSFPSIACLAQEMGVTLITFPCQDISDACGALCLPIPAEQANALLSRLNQLLADTLQAALPDIWGIEIVHYPPFPMPARFALFDFDGTISLIREGWQEVMIPYFAEILSAAPGAEGEPEITACVTDFVDRLTGKQTIFQCIRLDEEVQKRGGAGVNPGDYKAEYLRRLGEHTKARIQALQSGADPRDFLVPGSDQLLALLHQRGYQLYLASGTDEADVIAEANLLGIGHWFNGHIHGALENLTDCSKELVIRDILRKNSITGKDLLSFGDGFVEIELVKHIGGYSVGVASDEARRKGIHQRKRAKLLEAGADMILPDFSEAEALLNRIENGGI